MSPSSGRPSAPSLALNAASIAGGEVVGRIAAMLSFMVLARFFTPEIYGQLAFAASLSAMAAPFVDFGLSSVSGAKISRQPSMAGTIVGQIWGLRLSLALVSIALIGVFGAWYDDGQLLGLSMAYAVGLLPAAFATTWVAYLLGIPRFFFYEKSLQAALFVALVAGAVLTGRRPIAIAAAAVVSAAVAVGGTLPSVIRSSGLAVRWVRTGAIDLLRESFPIFLTLLPAAVLLPLVSLAVGWSVGTEALGLFWLAARLLVLGPIAGNFAATMLVPLLASRPDDRAYRLRMLRAAVWSVCAIGGTAAWFVAVDAEMLVEFLFGPLHAEAAPLVAWTGGIIAAESTSIVLTRLSPYFGTSASLRRSMSAALLLGVAVWAVCWPWLGVPAFMVGMFSMHAGVALFSALSWPAEERRNLLTPPVPAALYLVALSAMEAAIRVIDLMPLAGFAVRAAAALCIMLFILSKWRTTYAISGERRS